MYTPHSTVRVNTRNVVHNKTSTRLSIVSLGAAHSIRNGHLGAAPSIIHLIEHNRNPVHDRV